MLTKSILTVVFTTVVSTIWALAPNTTAPLYQHLIEVNARWQFEEPNKEMMQPVSFTNDTRRIQAHLYQVEKLLRSQPTTGLSIEQFTSRMNLLNVLHGYATAAVFPQNYDFDYRIPYFIDEHNTACAVGYLIIEDGREDLAQLIVSKGNNKYLLDMDYPELMAWVAQSGFTAKELALIQPGYQANTPFTNFEGGSGTNGEVLDILVDATNDVVYIGGTFTEIDGQGGFNNIAMYANGTWDNMDGGLSGTVHDLAIYKNVLYAAGAFDSSMTGTYSQGIIRWAIPPLAIGPDFYDWLYVESAGLYGEVYALQEYGGLLFLGGDFELPTGAIRGYLTAINDTQAYLLGEMPWGPVYSLCVHNGQLVAAGDFNVTTYGDSIDNIGVFDTSNYEFNPIGTGLSWPVLAVQSFDGKLFAGGSLALQADSSASGFANFDTIWTDQAYYIGQYPIGDTIHRISSFMVNASSLYIAGDFYCCQGAIILFFGYNLAEYSAGGGIGAVTSFNNRVNTIAYYNGELAVGGIFDTVVYGGGFGGPILLGQNLGGLAMKGDTYNSIETVDGLDLSFNMYPVPASNTLTVKFEGNLAQVALQAIVFNLQGQQLSVTNFTGNSANINTSSLAAGAYLIQIVNPKGLVATGKFIVE